MKDDFVVTVGVCVKNGESVLRRTIEGILNQDFPHGSMEVVFVDDGSKDNTLSIMLESALKMDMRVRVFHQKWSGLGVASNVVVNNACGKYLLWVDDDMMLPKNHVRGLVDFVERNPGVAAAGVKYVQGPEDNMISLLENLMSKSAYFKYSRNQPLAGGALILRLSVVKQVGGYDSELRAASADTDLISRIKASGWRLVRRTVSHHSSSPAMWTDVWKKYFRYGYSSHYVYDKNRSIFALYKKLPLLCFLDGLTLFPVACRLASPKDAALLPFYYAFIRTVWFLGFVTSHIDGYGHK